MRTARRYGRAPSVLHRSHTVELAGAGLELTASAMSRDLATGVNSPVMNRRIVLASRPAGEPTPENFRLEADLQGPEPASGQILVKNLALSIDPYMRGRMSDRPSYARPVGIGEVMVGGTVGRV